MAYRPQVSDKARSQIVQIQGKLAQDNFPDVSKGDIVETAVNLLLCVLDTTLAVQERGVNYPNGILNEVTETVCYALEKTISNK